MITSSNHNNLPRLHRIHHPIPLLNPAQPKFTQNFAQGFGLADAGEGLAQRGFDEYVTAPQGLLVLRLPPRILLPSRLRDRTWLDAIKR
jgi:hypothetical protein